MRKLTSAQKGALWLTAGGFCLVRAAGSLGDSAIEADARVKALERRAHAGETASARVSELVTELETAGVIELVEDDDGLFDRPRAVAQGADEAP